MTADRPLYTRTFWYACALHFTGGMSHAMLLLLPLWVRHLGGDDLLIGLLLGSGMAVSVAARPTVGAALDRFGRRRVLLWAGGLNVASLPLFCTIAATGTALTTLVVVHHVIGGALFAAYFTYAADLVPAARRGEGIAIFGVAGMLSNGVGPPLGEWLIARTGYPAYFAAAAGFALVSLALTFTVPDAPPAPHPVAPRRDWRTLRLTLHRARLFPVLAATLLFGAGVNAAFFFVAPFTRDLGLARAAPFFVAYASTTIALRVTGRRLPDRLGPHRIAVPAFAVFALGLGGLCFLPAPGMLVLAGVACGAGHGSLFPVLNTLAVARTPAALHGTIVSLYTAAMDLGGVLGTPLCGALARAFGYRTMFALTATTAVAGVALMMRDARLSRPPPPA